MGKPKVTWCVTLCDMDQLFLDNLQRARGQGVIGLSVGEFQRIAQERDARFGLLSEIIDRVPRHDHLRNKLHIVGIVTAYVMEQVPYLGSSAVLVVDRGGRFQKCVVGKCTKKANCIEEVGLARTIGPNYTGKRAKV